MEANYDLAIIGGGPGGYVAAIRAAMLGAKVALIEKGEMGGTCLNLGCIPTKTLIHCIETLQEVRHAATWGVRLDESSIRPDWQAMLARKDTVVAQLRSGIAQLVRGNGITLYHGNARLLNARRIAIRQNDGAGEQEIEAHRIILATGSRPARPSVEGANLPGVITSDEFLSLDHIPQSIVIIGGSIIGIELASLLAPLGTRITILELLPSILPTIDAELARRYYTILRQAGITIHQGAAAHAITQSDAGLTVTFGGEKGEAQADGEYVLMATGRTPYIEGVNLDAAGVRVFRRAVLVDEAMATNVPGIYAIGDCTGGIMLAHVASYQAEIAVENALHGRARCADYTCVPSCVYSLPEIAGVGLTESMAEAQGIGYTTGKFPFGALGRAQTLGETTGLVKLICEEGSGHVLGVHMIGSRASDLIAEGALAVRHGLTANDLAQTIHAHPTLAEAIYEVALGLNGGAIHTLRPRKPAGATG